MLMLMEETKKHLRDLGFSGEIEDTPEVLRRFSHDASMFEIVPKLVIAPKNTADVEIAVKYVADHKKKNQNLSLTARSAGTDMSGGAINDSIIIDFLRHMNKVDEGMTVKSARTQPGAYFRDFDKVSRTHQLLLPTYPASRDLCTVGGMVANNSGGEKSIEFGCTEDFVNELQVVFADGVTRTVKPLNKHELDAKMAQDDFEGEVYRKMFRLVDDNYDVIKNAKPNVSKDSTGYHLWRVWDRETGIFDLTQVVVGSQGTLGLVTDIDFKMINERTQEGLLVMFLKNIDNLPELVNDVVAVKPSRFESFDDNTLWLSIRFMPSFLKLLGPVQFIHLLITLIPTGLLLFRGLPQLILMVSIKGNDTEEVAERIRALRKDLQSKAKLYGITGFEELPREMQGQKFWTMRRYSFQILRSKVKDKHTAPFIDDLIVRPEFLPKFLPQIRKIIKKYKLFATIAGHMGDGNFHIIPLMNIEKESERQKLLPAMKEVNELVLKYGGSLSGEHNDGLVRGPWLEQMYGKEVLKLFKETKKIFDPQGIFNPRKKADADWDYSYSHIRQNFDE